MHFIILGSRSWWISQIRQRSERISVTPYITAHGEGTWVYDHCRSRIEMCRRVSLPIVQRGPCVAPSFMFPSSVRPQADEHAVVLTHTSHSMWPQPNLSVSLSSSYTVSASIDAALPPCFRETRPKKRSEAIAIQTATPSSHLSSLRSVHRSHV